MQVLSSFPEFLKIAEMFVITNDRTKGNDGISKS